jgi:MoaA/NifB/PqqE/SkfB family radical SAM enzyme
MSEEMNLVKKLKTKDVLERINAIEFDGSSIVGPYVVELDPTAACDMACPGCISEDIISIGGRFSNSRLIELPDEFKAAGVKAVILIGGGEPLTHPKVGEFITMSAERDIQIGITTNGTLIHKYLDEIAEHSSWTRVSMDAGTQITFDKLRPTKTGKSAFNKIVENMTSLGKIKKGLMGYSYLLQSPADGEGVIANLEDMHKACKLAKEIGCDYFEVKPSYAWRGDIPHALMVHEKSFLEKALEELESADFKILHAINLKYSLKGVQSPQIKDYKTCPSAQLRTLITPKGVYVCPYWRGKNNFKIGDVNQNTLADVWRSDEKKKTMSNLDPSEQCNFHCLRHDTNMASFKIKEMLLNGDLDSSAHTDTQDRFI